MKRDATKLIRLCIVVLNMIFAAAFPLRGGYFYHTVFQERKEFSRYWSVLNIRACPLRLAEMSMRRVFLAHICTMGVENMRIRPILF